MLPVKSAKKVRKNMYALIIYKNRQAIYNFIKS